MRELFKIGYLEERECLERIIFLDVRMIDTNNYYIVISAERPGVITKLFSGVSGNKEMILPIVVEYLMKYAIDVDEEGLRSFLEWYLKGEPLDWIIECLIEAVNLLIKLVGEKTRVKGVEDEG